MAVEKNEMVKCLPIMRETWVQPLGQEDLLEKEMVTHSSILAWRIPWTKKLVGYRPWGPKELDTTERLHFHFHLEIFRNSLKNKAEIGVNT